MLLASTRHASVAPVGIRESTASAAALNASAEILGDDHQDHDEQPCAERPGIGTDDVKQLPHAYIMRRQERIERKAAGLKLG